MLSLSVVLLQGIISILVKQLRLPVCRLVHFHYVVTVACMMNGHVSSTGEECHEDHRHGRCCESVYHEHAPTLKIEIRYVASRYPYSGSPEHLIQNLKEAKVSS